MSVPHEPAWITPRRALTPCRGMLRKRPYHGERHCRAGLVPAQCVRVPDA
ncbi:MAG: hypothetical protein GXC76_07755 [Rhodanobacteraceae bacterium]|jgi:hypothetical protein|nr:hypothetical protein [Rhodanobacteraceae bacterium]